MAQPSNQTPEFQEYNAAEKYLLAQALAFAILFFTPWLSVPMTDVQWFSLIEQLFPYIQRLRTLSSIAARNYYDKARSAYLRENVVDLDRLPGTRNSEVDVNLPLQLPDDNPSDRHDMYLADFEPEFLHVALEEVKQEFKKEVTRDTAATQAAAIVGREVMNGGRKTLIQAVPNDPIGGNKGVLWARVQGGGESCAFCWMLISRGPVYHSAESAGFIGIGMDEWHPNCDCQVVPVFDKNGEWPGKDDWIAAEELWKQATKGLSGKGKKKNGEEYDSYAQYRAFRKALADGIVGDGDPDLPVPKFDNQERYRRRVSNGFRAA